MGDNIKTDLTEMGWCELDSSASEQGKLVGSCKHGNEHSDFIKCMDFHEQVGPVGSSGLCSM
jgi:hypothetical protein